MLICCATLSAQNFQPNTSQQPSNSWQPPAIQYNPPPTANSTVPIDPEKWWPNEPAKQDTKVRPANVEVPLPEFDHGAGQSGEMLTNLKESATDKMAGLFGSAEGDSGWGEKIKDKFAGVDVKKMLGSLAIVLGGYFGFVWLVRRFNSGAPGKLPSEVLDVVGTAPFGPRKNLQLVRLGSKLLLLLSGPEGTHPIGEITDANEVQHLTTLCNRRTVSRSTDNTGFKNLMGRLQAGLPSAMPTAATRTFATPPATLAHANAEPVQASPVQTAAANTTSELERIVQRLSSVIDQTSGRNVFEA